MSPFAFEALGEACIGGRLYIINKENNMRNKLIPLALCLTLFLGLFAGCQSSKLRSRSEDALKEPPADTTETATMVKDYTAVYESFAPDELMLTVNGREVSWGELFYWYEFEVTSLEGVYGEIEDWDAPSIQEPDKTNREFIMDRALDTVKHYRSLETEAEALGVSLTEEDKQALADLWQSNVDAYGGGSEEAFVEYLSKVFMTKELYQHISSLRFLMERTISHLYGENGEKLNEQEVLEKGGELGYVRAKHILISNKDDGGAALPEEKLSEKKALAERLIAELQAISDTGARAARFDELIAEYGADPGLTYYTDGYTFQAGAGKLDVSFEAATAGLADYGVSDPVETIHGYHIIMRLPLKADAAIELMSETEKLTLAYFVSQELFAADSEGWARESQVEFTETYQKMDLGAIFAKATKVAA